MQLKSADPDRKATENFRPNDNLAHTADAGFMVERSKPTIQQLQELYRENQAEARRSFSRKGLWFAVFIYLLFSMTDVLLIADVAPYTVSARIVVGIFALVSIEIQYRYRRKPDVLDMTCAIALVSGYVGWLLPAMTSGEELNLSYYMVFGAIFMMGINLFFNFRFFLALSASAAVLAAFLVSLCFFSGDLHHTLSFIIFYFCCFVFTSYVNWKLNEERYQVFLNSIEASAQHQEANERGRALLRLSNTDPLTGLANRRAIDRTMRGFWDGWRSRHESFTAILIDVDHFKKFNDLYGHQDGDKCLVRVAEVLEIAVQKFGGAVGRYGGEEFIVLAHADTAPQSFAFAESIRRAVEDMIPSPETLVQGAPIVTVSVGAAVTGQHSGTKLEKLIHEADRALYSAKAGGRNCTRLYDPLDAACRDEEEDLVALLRVALRRDLMSLVYQPIHNVASGSTNTVEALMRMKTIEGTSIPPTAFIPVAEQTGAILELGRWLVRTVCLELLANNRIHVVSVNISPIQLKADGFAESIAAILLETGVDGSRLAFEITEGLDMDVDTPVLTCVEELRRLGISIWLDDFGTGFSGLSWLRLIDFDTVKIDKSFLNDAKSPRGKAMLHDIVSLLRNHVDNILVEGVETEEDMMLARELWIDQVQGYHLGRPVPAHLITTADSTVGAVA
jgi:diguanylate cyclase (GGDEF)-like protein